jgi:phosphocarrier protein HPr
MVSRQVSVSNALGLHARAAARFVHRASQFTSRIRVTKGGQTVDGKSILGLLLLAAARGTTLDLEADGDDAQAAMDALVQLVDAGFDEQ